MAEQIAQEERRSDAAPTTYVFVDTLEEGEQDPFTEEEQRIYAQILASAPPGVAAALKQIRGPIVTAVSAP